MKYTIKQTLNKLSRVFTGEAELIDVYYFIQGNIRDWLYYNKPRLLRTHIREQIKWRIQVMNQKCYDNSSCVGGCGCDVTELQCANKTCDNYCYPFMMNKSTWNKFNKSSHFKEYTNILINKNNG